MAQIHEDAHKEFEVETPLGKLRAKGYHLGNVLQAIIAAGVVVGVLVFLDMRQEAKDTWIAMASVAKSEHAAIQVFQEKMIKVMDSNTAAIRFQTCVNAVTPEQRVHQLKRNSACWYMGQGYAYEELGPERPR